MHFLTRAMQYQPGNERLGRSFTPKDSTSRKAMDGWLGQINALSQVELGAEDVTVRGMLLCNTQRDYYYSRFTREALDEVAEMAVGAPVMVGHDYRGLPIGRMFQANVVRIEDATLLKHEQFWVEVLYYVPNDDEGQRFVRRVDTGTWREVSIGFRLASTPCSVCSRPIWACAHMPGEIYARGGVCEWGMEAITSVLEGSQVFRGGQKDTSQFVPEGAGESRYRRSALLEGTGDIDARLLLAAKRANLLDRLAEPFGLSVEEFLKTDEAANGLARGWFFGKRGERANTQALQLSKARFGTATRAARWVRDHDFRADKRKDSAGEFVFEQFAETVAEPNSLRQLPLEEGVTARVCTPKKEDDEDGRALDGGGARGESVEQWLERQHAPA